ncbi:hypothetical protein Ancab_007743, partial [Ancistrocladus abbreviatus]
WGIKILLMILAPLEGSLGPPLQLNACPRRSQQPMNRPEWPLIRPANSAIA